MAKTLVLNTYLMSNICFSCSFFVSACHPHPKTKSHIYLNPLMGHCLQI